MSYRQKADPVLLDLRVRPVRPHRVQRRKEHVLDRRVHPALAACARRARALSASRPVGPGGCSCAGGDGIRWEGGAPSSASCRATSAAISSARAHSACCATPGWSRRTRISASTAAAPFFRASRMVTNPEVDLVRTPTGGRNIIAGRYRAAAAAHRQAPRAVRCGGGGGGGGGGCSEDLRLSAAVSRRCWSVGGARGPGAANVAPVHRHFPDAFRRFNHLLQSGDCNHCTRRMFFKKIVMPLIRPLCIRYLQLSHRYLSY